MKHPALSFLLAIIVSAAFSHASDGEEFFRFRLQVAKRVVVSRGDVCMTCNFQVEYFFRGTSVLLVARIAPLRFRVNHVRDSSKVPSRCVFTTPDAVSLV